MDTREPFLRLSRSEDDQVISDDKGVELIDEYGGTCDPAVFLYGPYAVAPKLYEACTNAARWLQLARENRPSPVPSSTIELDLWAAIRAADNMTQAQQLLTPTVREGLRTALGKQAGARDALRDVEEEIGFEIPIDTFMEAASEYNNSVTDAFLSDLLEKCLAAKAGGPQ